MPARGCSLPSIWRRPRSLSLLSPSAQRSWPPCLGPVLFQKRWLEACGSRSPNPSTTKRDQSLLTVAIETSCDDTCVAVLLKKKGALGAARLLFQARVTSDNSRFGGIHPLEAANSHMTALAHLVRQALPTMPGPKPAQDFGFTEFPASVIDESGQRVWRARPDFISVTRGPGMMSSLATGLTLAKGLAAAWGVPLVGVNHMQAHALTPRLVSALSAEADSWEDAHLQGQVEYPFLSLLVSGGHTLLLCSTSVTEHTLLAESGSMAVGDLLDKCGRAILTPEEVGHVDSKGGVPCYGAKLEEFAFPNGLRDIESWYSPKKRRQDEIREEAPLNPTDPGKHYPWSIKVPFADSREMRFDFTALNGQVLSLVRDRSEIKEPSQPPLDECERRTLARETMRVAFEHLASRVIFALQAELDAKAETLAGAGAHRLRRLVVSGGVASNAFLLHVLRTTLEARGFGDIEVLVPPRALCTDNAPMIGWAGMEMFEAGYTTDLNVMPVRKWPLDPRSEGGGLMGLDGWVSRRKPLPAGEPLEKPHVVKQTEGNSVG